MPSPPLACSHTTIFLPLGRADSGPPSRSLSAQSGNKLITINRNCLDLNGAKTPSYALEETFSNLQEAFQSISSFLVITCNFTSRASIF